MEKIVYKPELFDILKDLVPISKSVIIKKEADQIVIRRANTDVTILYCIKAPLEYFNYPDTNDDVSFYNYGEFYQYLKSFVQPEIYIDKNKLTLRENNSKIDYVLSSTESFEKKTPKEPKPAPADISFTLSSKDHNEISNMIALIKPKKAKITLADKKVNVMIYNSTSTNSFEKTFDVESSTEEEIDFNIDSDTFNYIPFKHDYKVEIRAVGFVKITLLNSPIQLDMYTGKVVA